MGKEGGERRGLRGIRMKDGLDVEILPLYFTIVGVWGGRTMEEGGERRGLMELGVAGPEHSKAKLNPMKLRL